MGVQAMIVGTLEVHELGGIARLHHDPVAEKRDSTDVPSMTGFRQPTVSSPGGF